MDNAKKKTPQQQRLNNPYTEKKLLYYCFIVSGLALNGNADKSKSISAIKKKLLKANH